MRLYNTLVLLLAYAGISGLHTSCTKEESLPKTTYQESALRSAGPFEPLAGRDAMSQDELDQYFNRKFLSQGIISWSQESDYTAWSAAVRQDSVWSIGFAPEGFHDLSETIHTIDVTRSPWREIKDALIDFVVEETRKKYPEEAVSRESLVVFGDKPLPYFNIRIWDYSIAARLRHLTVVRYAEPMYSPLTQLSQVERSSSGCGENQGLANVPPSDFFTSPQGAKLSWNLPEMKIHKAWKTSNRGDGITLGLIDTGVSPDQEKLNEEFGGGLSGTRTIEKYGFHDPCFLFVFCENDGVDDLCGHGTNMAGALCAPFSSDGSFAGVAFKSNLISIRAAEDVIHNTSAEKDGVSDAFTYLADRADVQIISMSMGDLFSSSQIEDAIDYAHNQGKMIFAAAGTSLSFTTFVGVIFPANLPTTLAVTGVRTGSVLQKCTSCHSGPEVDFVITMEDEADENRTPLTLAQDGLDPAYTGGSSVATATAAGIAALVWSEDLSQSREEVLDQLIASSSFYPVRNSQFGWGVINAQMAVQL